MAPAMSERSSGAHAGSAGPPPAGTARPRRQSPIGPVLRPLAGPDPRPACARGSWPSIGTTTCMVDCQ
eukprot:8133074-Alexandrium_andersonii.AAC.1